MDDKITLELHEILEIFMEWYKDEAASPEQLVIPTEKNAATLAAAATDYFVARAREKSN